ncbi:hypothetical protein ACFB49_23240 [Sphingomonas sp. DBB INV C78]|uniref:TetR/AcrR family transcriptional regulator n=1 Tax=Sphingomonas sp. DBB INV C78 TaxID=3349434 RepID=UPI000248AB4B|nr:TetR family transcriptional regulator [Sphingomonas sp. KC8]
MAVTASPGRRGRRPLVEGPALDRKRLTDTLVEMAHARGIEALSIRAVAQALGVSPRLIYLHVRDKEEMLGLLTDEILRARMPDLTSGDWQTRLRRIVAAVHVAYRDVPGSAGFILGRSANRLDQPHALKIRQAIFAALGQAGLDERQCEEMLILFSVVVLGNVVIAESLPAADAQLAVRRERVEAAFARSTDMLLDAIEKAATDRRD